MEHSRVILRSGWSMKEVESEEWLPVKKVPSQVHVDLLANNMYAYHSSHNGATQSQS